ncbi:leucyl aminopeptidase [Paenalcaligenes sp.]|uniref:leucyl aminopeptidase n=1 Tax=Paenalcaligenes sp. TaxID=1966342 RepID=UPI002611CD25|nr:leucyl aminopeptidase [Paenalcaligenes sp.]
MEFSTQTTTDLAQIQTEALAVGVFKEQKLSPAAEQIDQASAGALREVLAHEFKADAKTHLVLRQLPGVQAKRVVLIGLGEQKKYNAKAHAAAENTFANYCKSASLTEAVSTLASIDTTDNTLTDRARAAAQAVGAANYHYDATLSKKNQSQAIAQFSLWCAPTQAAEAQTGLSQGQAIANGVSLTRLLADLPPNICTPTYLANTAKKLADEFDSIKVEVLERKQIEALKMGAFLSVAKGSDEPPVFIVIKHTPANSTDEAPLVLVGKGLTFDAGGISLKPAANMDEMKYDMGGAASVLGSMRAVAELGLNREIIGIIAACENLPSGKANKPGDVVTSMAGKTIEILNTDAEGRLVLCDALTYAERFKPASVINIATLTGACVVALGDINSGLFSNDDALAEQLKEASQQANDSVWQLPISDEYQAKLKSNFADIANIGTPGAGSITAACFLARFTENYAWAHLDIAGTAWNSGANKGATGRPVPLLVQYLINQTVNA